MGLETTNAQDVEFSPASSGLSSTNVQDAIDELASKGNGALYVHLTYSYASNHGTADKTAEEVYQAYQDGLAVFLVVTPLAETFYDIVPLYYAENDDGAIRILFIYSGMFPERGSLTEPALFTLTNENPPGFVEVTYPGKLSADDVPVGPIDGIDAGNVQDALEAINAKIPEQSASGGPTIRTATISAGGWSGGDPPGNPDAVVPNVPSTEGEPAYQIVGVMGVVADSSTQAVDVVPATREDMDKWNEYGVWCTDQGTNKLVFTCKSCPASSDTPTPPTPGGSSKDIQVNIRMWEVST